MAKRRMRANFEFIDKFGVELWCFHDRDLEDVIDRLIVECDRKKLLELLNVSRMRMLKLILQFMCLRLHRQFQFVQVLHWFETRIQVPMAGTSAAATETDTVAPLFRPRQEAGRPTNLALLLGRATGRRGASMLVRETAAQQLEERRADWGYSRPVVALDMMWNMAFVVVSVVVMFCSMSEKTNLPIRNWICGYALQCSVHGVLVSLELFCGCSSGLWNYLMSYVMTDGDSIQSKAAGQVWG